MNDVIHIGTLRYAPALQHPDLLAPVVHSAISHGIATNARVAQIDENLADTGEFLAAYGTDAADSANCVVVIGRRGETRTPAACLVPSDTRADVNTRVRKLLDARKASFAPHDWAIEQTGMEYGGITAIGLPESWRLLVDSRVTERDWVIIGGGTRRSKIALPGPDFEHLPGAEIVDELGLTT